MTSLSPRDAKVLTYLRKAVTDEFCPNYRQIGAATGLLSTSQVHGALESLKAKGWVRVTSDRRRGIELADPLAGKPTAELVAMRKRIDVILAGRVY